MSYLSICSLTKRFGNHLAVDNFSQIVEQGELVVVLGPSGCGKTTLLRLICGLERPDSGEITLDGKSLIDVPPHLRDVAMVFQNYALYPHMSAFDNIAFSLRMAGLPEDQILARVTETAESLGLASLLKKRPAQCSGGERQRIALGRAIIRRPRLFLFDEPLSNLDTGLREVIRVELRNLLTKLKATALFVTHDQHEAMALADRIALLSSGKLVQFGPPRELYDSPSSLFAAMFIGSPKANRLNGNAANGVFSINDSSLSCPLGLTGSVALVFRCEDVQITQAGIPARVQSTEFLGDRQLVHLILLGEHCVMAASPSEQLKRDTEIRVAIRPGYCLWFDPTTGALLQRG